jgi:hypothetical protein
MKSRLLIVVAVLSAAVFAVACGSSGPGGTVKSYISYMEKGDMDSAMKLMSTKDMPPGMKDSKEVKDKMKQVGDQASKEIKGKGGVKSVDILKEDIKGDNAEVKFKIKYGNGTEDDEKTAKLVKEDGQWKIAG